MKKFIVLAEFSHTSGRRWVSGESDDFQEAVALYIEEGLRGNVATIVSPIEFMTLENIDQDKPPVHHQYDMFEEV